MLSDHHLIVITKSGPTHDHSPTSRCHTVEILRRHAEDEYAAELAALAAADDRPRPPGWRLSPQAVVAYLMGRGGRHAEVHRVPSADGGGCRDAGY
jgi:hypothetical protein